MRSVILYMSICMAVQAFGVQSRAGESCQNPNALRVAEWALVDLQDKILPDESEVLNTAQLNESCAPNWFSNIFVDFAADTGSFYNHCGINIEFQNETDMLDFADKLHEANSKKDFVSVVDIFAVVSVPVCGVLTSQDEKQ